ncbi:heterokaryon incompatibility protein-domain-containing protein, partial [Cercophora newfieldiana]
MRLINTQTLQLEQFLTKRPPYAILSHTWGAEEVTFQDFMNPSVRKRKAGYKKIELTCSQARKDGYKYAWVDTCCIDKTNHTELDEAINSMFKWYQASGICYVYLADVSDNDNVKAKNSKFPRSRWFTRGWTLQELIASPKVIFYGASWGKLGEKNTLGPQLSEATNIRPSILQGGRLSDVSVAERFSWAAHRQTTREEDIAYCLMGFFDVHMPIMYGEGSKAFVRLQEQIWENSDDHTLFAW